MGNLIRIIQVTTQILGFVLAEVIPFGRAIQKLFKENKDVTRSK